jgi:hypothetical protein
VTGFYEHCNKTLGSEHLNRCYAQDFSLFHSVQIGFGAHAASYLMVTGDSFPWGKRPGSEADYSPHLVPTSRKVELYLHSPIRLDGIVLN